MYIDYSRCVITLIKTYLFFSESALLILDSKWTDVEPQIKSDFSSILEQVLHFTQSMRCHLEAVKTCHFLLGIVKEPWSHHYLPKLLHGNPSQEEGIF